jgi:YD repeat-containing protein
MEMVTEDYTYDPATFQLTSVSVAGTVERAFGYAPSGQMTRDNRAGQGGSDFAFENNARGRLVRVFENAALAASYLYDEEDQRIAKTTSSGTTHYHYDLEGRLISETDGATGQAIREYLWIGLSPVAMIASSGGLPVGCDLDEAARIEALRDARQATLDTITAQVAVLTDTRATRVQTRATVAARRDRLQGLLEATNPTNTARIADLKARVARDDGRLADLDANIADLDERLAYYAERTDYLTGRVDALTRRADQLNAACEAANDNTQSAALLLPPHRPSRAAKGRDRQQRQYRVGRRPDDTVRAGYHHARELLRKFTREFTHTKVQSLPCPPYGMSASKLKRCDCSNP